MSRGLPYPDHGIRSGKPSASWRAIWQASRGSRIHSVNRLNTARMADRAGQCATMKPFKYYCIQESIATGAQSSVSLSSIPCAAACTYMYM